MKGPRQVLPFSDDRDEELRHRLPDTPVAAPQLQVCRFTPLTPSLKGTERDLHHSIQNSIPDSIGNPQNVWPLRESLSGLGVSWGWSRTSSSAPNSNALRRLR